MSVSQSFITIAVISLATIITRFLPFIIFPDNKKPPEFISYLAKVLPTAVIGFLVVYCLRYSFDSYFTAEVKGIENISISKDAEAVTIDIMRSYDFSLELVSLSARVLITVALEIVIALIFMYRD
ncbi:MAG: branched-chain amino acid transporter permease, partial [Erysipelotrichaceae bacterium]